MTTTHPGCPYAIDPVGTDIQAECATLRAYGPATPVELTGGVRAWAITDTGLARRLMTNPLISRDAYQHWPEFRDGTIPEDWPLRIWVSVRNAFTAYGKEHDRLRRLLRPAFTPRRIRALAPTIQDHTNQLLEGLARDAGPDGVVDLVPGMTWQLPMRTLNALLDVPEHMHDALRSASDGIFTTGHLENEATSTSRTAYALLDELIDARRATPGEDAVSALIEARDDETGSRLSQQELLDSLLLLISGGHESTVHLLGHAVVNLLTHPDQLELVRSGAADWADVVEETLRHQSPFGHVPARYPIEDVYDEPTGLTLRRGEPLLISHAAMGRDPLVHGDDVERFDITRPTKQEHLSFGYGTHFCLGAELARLESRLALAALFERFPKLQLAVPAGELQPVESFISNGYRSIPVRLG